MAFSLFSSNTLESLLKKSGKIVDIFTATKKELAEVNAQIDVRSSEVTAQITALSEEATQLSALSAQNKKVIANIDKILE